MPLTIVKTVVLAAMPSTSATTAGIVNALSFSSSRTARRTSFQTVILNPRT